MTKKKEIQPTTTAQDTAKQNEQVVTTEPIILTPEEVTDLLASHERRIMQLEKAKKTIDKAPVNLPPSLPMETEPEPKKQRKRWFMSTKGIFAIIIILVILYFIYQYMRTNGIPIPFLNMKFK